MALHIRDAETDRLVRTLAARKGLALTDAIKLAVRNELLREAEKPSLRERLKPLHEGDYALYKSELGRMVLP